MEDDVGPDDRREVGHPGGVGHVLDVELGAALERGLEVLDASRREVVDDVHLVAARDERVGEMGADESGAAGDEGLHEPTEARPGAAPKPG